MLYLAFIEVVTGETLMTTRLFVIMYKLLIVLVTPLLFVQYSI